MSENSKVINQSPAAVSAMSGWKTKYGTIAFGIGASLLAAADVIPEPTLVAWLKFAGTLLTGLGGATATFGIGHKIEKNRSTTINFPERQVDKRPPMASVTKESP
jgi:hypothetical protein